MKANARIERDPEGRPLRAIGTTMDVTGDKLVDASEAASRAKSLLSVT